jgi:hypothetical protein
MGKSRAKLWFLLCGIALSTATPLCHAQETETQSEVIKPQETVSPALLPKTINFPSPISPEAKPSKEASELPWYWRFMGWLAMDYARYNTDKQSDGRPNQLGYFR